MKRCFDGMKNQIQFPLIRKNVNFLLRFMKVRLHVMNIVVVTCQYDICKKNNNSSDIITLKNLSAARGWSGAQHQALILQRRKMAVVIYSFFWVQSGSYPI